VTEYHFKSLVDFFSKVIVFKTAAYIAISIFV